MEKEKPVAESARLRLAQICLDHRAAESPERVLAPEHGLTAEYMVSEADEQLRGDLTLPEVEIAIQELLDKGYGWPEFWDSYDELDLSAGEYVSDVSFAHTALTDSALGI